MQIIFKINLCPLSYNKIDFKVRVNLIFEYIEIKNYKAVILFGLSQYIYLIFLFLQPLNKFVA